QAVTEAPSGLYFLTECVSWSKATSPHLSSRLSVSSLTFAGCSLLSLGGCWTRDVRAPHVTTETASAARTAISNIKIRFISALPDRQTHSHVGTSFNPCQTQFR